MTIAVSLSLSLGRPPRVSLSLSVVLFLFSLASFFRFVGRREERRTLGYLRARGRIEFLSARLSLHFFQFIISIIKARRRLYIDAVLEEERCACSFKPLTTSLSSSFVNNNNNRLERAKEFYKPSRKSSTRTSTREDWWTSTRRRKIRRSLPSGRWFWHFLYSW